MEDWKKKYEELFGHVQDFYKRFSDQCSIKREIEECIPELVESDDERIRKKCIELIKRVIPSGNNQSSESKDILDCIAYLEKQKEPFIIHDTGFSKMGKMPEYFLDVKPAEWSEEDENKIESIKGLITMGKFVDTNTIRTIWKLLDSLRPRPHWKPSEEQMEWLESAVRLSTDKPRIHGIIISLYEQLKRL